MKSAKSASVLAALLTASTAAGQDVAPATLDEFRAAAARILQASGVPGAGLALVRRDGVEWAGGIGLADRDRQVPVTADTHFRVGSISKTFVALALVQLYEDGLVNLDAPVSEIAPDIAIDNPWDATDPVRIIHLLQHTAGFDDMHLNEMYVPPGEAERSLAAVLLMNPRSRGVRWPPGTRMSYSNPGYAVAARVLETVTGEPYEDYITREILAPLAMTTSSFRLTPADELRLAQGHREGEAPVVGFPQIYLRPAGNLHTSAAELARFVQMLLNWGELGTAFVVDPEYLGTMEQPSTTLAAAAGLRLGYGAGVYARLDLPYVVLGHDGGIAGFTSAFGYSPARDVGYVVLLNAEGAAASNAKNQLASLALRYLKRDVEPPRPTTVTVATDDLAPLTGYYLEANPRSQLAWAIQFLSAGRSVVVEEGQLVSQPFVGTSVRLIPVSSSQFRAEDEVDACCVFAHAPDGTMVLTGAQIYAERVSRWRVEVVRLPVLTALSILASVGVSALAWLIRWRRARPAGFWLLKSAVLACPLALVVPAVWLAATPMTNWGTPAAGPVALFLGTMLLPLLGLVVAALALRTEQRGASRWLTSYAGLVALATAVVSVYLASHGLLGLATWEY